MRSERLRFLKCIWFSWSGCVLVRVICSQWTWHGTVYKILWNRRIKHTRKLLFSRRPRVREAERFRVRTATVSAETRQQPHKWDGSLSPLLLSVKQRECGCTGAQEAVGQEIRVSWWRGAVMVTAVLTVSRATVVMRIARRNPQRESNARVCRASRKAVEEKAKQRYFDISINSISLVLLVEGIKKR